MQCVHRGEHVEKRATRTRREKHALRRETVPCEILTSEKDEAETERRPQPHQPLAQPLDGQRIGAPEAIERAADSSARELERSAADYEHQRVPIKNGRQHEVLPCGE